MNGSNREFVVPLTIDNHLRNLDLPQRQDPDLDRPDRRQMSDPRQVSDRRQMSDQPQPRGHDLDHK